MINVYSKPACVQCEATKRRLDKLGLTYTVIDLTENPDALTYVTSLGYLQAPVVEDTDTNRAWSGYRPDLLDMLTLP